MEVRTIIQSQANVLRVTSLKIGNVVKIVETKYSEPEIRYAIVLDLLNSGKETFVQFLIYTKSYNSVTAEMKTYSGSKDLSLFPATVDEVSCYFKDTVKQLESDIAKSKKDLQEKIESVEKVKQFADGELSKKLSEASFEELTQAEYENKLKLLSQI